MATIIAARLQLQSQAEEAVDQLIRAGFAPEKVTSFYVNPPGQHALYPIGGDRYRSPVAEETIIGDVIAEVAEAVIGTDSHIVIHSKTHSEDAADRNKTGSVSRAHLRQLRKAGMMVAVELADPADQDRIVTLLTQLEGNDIEKAEGKIVDGEWLDFDPLSEPFYL